MTSLRGGTYLFEKVGHLVGCHSAVEDSMEEDWLRCDVVIGTYIPSKQVGCQALSMRRNSDGAGDEQLQEKSPEN